MTTTIALVFCQRRGAFRVRAVRTPFARVDSIDRNEKAARFVVERGPTVLRVRVFGRPPRASLQVEAMA